MTNNLHALYRALGAEPTCADAELRSAFRSAIKRWHPDLNPNDPIAAAKTVELNSAYKALLQYRQASGQGSGLVEPTTWPAGFHFGSAAYFATQAGPIDIQQITGLKSDLYRAWTYFQSSPDDTTRALRLIHAAFRADRPEVVSELLANRLLIDSALLLRDLVGDESARETLLQWAACILAPGRGIILEDLNASDITTEEVGYRLKSYHYELGTHSSLPPASRIQHLRRIIELGFELGYVYKLLAETYHEIGDDDAARDYLHHAFAIDPQLMGAKTISRALGFLTDDPSAATRSRASTLAASRAYPYWRTNQLPSPHEVRQWAHSGDWNTVCRFADVRAYSPNLISRSRVMLRQMALSLGACSEAWAASALERLLDCSYPDVQKPCTLSLARIGNQASIRALEGLDPRWPDGELCRDQAIAYLTARLDLAASGGDRLGEGPSRTAKLNQAMGRARRAFDDEAYGLARAVLEYALPYLHQGTRDYFDSLLLLAESCAEMGDENRALELTKDGTPLFPESLRGKLIEQMFQWFWVDLGLTDYNRREYDPSLDHDYVMGIHCGRYLVETATELEPALTHTHRLTRWLDLLGAGHIAETLRGCIRRAAPGTRFVDRYGGYHEYYRINQGPILERALAVQYQELPGIVQEKLESLLGQ